MLDDKSAKVRECLLRAEESARRPRAQSDRKTRLGFLDMERRWLLLARSYEFAERLARMIRDPKMPDGPLAE